MLVKFLFYLSHDNHHFKTLFINCSSYFDRLKDGGDMKQWFHPACMFETFVRARATTKKIEDPDDVEGFADLDQDGKDVILNLIKGVRLSFLCICRQCLNIYFRK